MTVKARGPAARHASSAENARLRELLAEAQDTLRAIRNGEVDAVVVESRLGPRVYTLAGAEFDYRMLIESMNEGALVLTRSAVILYANAHFALMAERPLEQIMGRSLYELLSAGDQATIRRILRRLGRAGGTGEVRLQRPPSAPLSARLSVRRLPSSAAKTASIGMVVSDLTEVRKREVLLRSLAQALIRLQENERQQLAAELGDNVTQSLCSILMRCQSLANRLPKGQADFREEALRLAELLRATANDVHGISTGLRPPGLQILGIVSELHAVVTEFADRLGMAIQLTLPKTIAGLAASSELALYRTLQDALRNVEKHAHARAVEVAVKRRGHVVQLTIKDDGVGFDVNDDPAQALRAGHFGLLRMHERATAVGGALTVTSAALAGTQVCLRVPLSQEPSSGE